MFEDPNLLKVTVDTLILFLEENGDFLTTHYEKIGASTDGIETLTTELHNLSENLEREACDPDDTGSSPGSTGSHVVVEATPVTVG